MAMAMVTMATMARRACATSGLLLPTLLALGCHAGASAHDAADPALLAASASLATDPEVTAADIARHVHALADDALAGRATGSAESRAAAAYLEAVLRDAGLRGAGDGGSFLQSIDTRRFTSAGPPVMQFLGEDSGWTAISDGGPAADREPVAAFGADFSYRSGGPVEGRFPLVVARTADRIPATPRADQALVLGAGGRQARQWLAAAGTPDGRGWGLLLLAGEDTAGAPDEGPVSGLLSAPAGQPLPPTTFYLRGPLRDRVLQIEFARVSVSLAAKSMLPAANVVGVLDGVGTPEHPELAQQAIVFTAHYDHLGVARNAGELARQDAAPAPPPAVSAAPGGAEAGGAPAVALDLIYNGADDDASGCAAVLELAQAFGAEARAGRPPARTLVFLLATGEEVGLLGTRYYLDHPVVPLERTVCNLNFEMIGRPDALAGGAGRLWLTGFERSNLGPAWAASGLAIAPDGRPQERFFERSDNYAFVMRGIVAQTLSTYNLHADYHHVTDEPQTLDFEHMQVAVRAGLAAARTLADGTLTPAWIGTPPGPSR